MPTTIYKTYVCILFFALQLCFAQKGEEALFIKEGTLLKCENSRIPADGRIELPRTVKAIAPEAFKDCSRLKSINIGGSVTLIGDRAFYGCNTLTKAEFLPNTVTAIGEQAFAFCGKLSSANLPNSLVTIGTEAFRACFALDAITIPESTTNIGDNAFLDCSSLQQVTFLTNQLSILPSGIFYQCKQLKEALLPASVRRIKSSAFA